MSKNSMVYSIQRTYILTHVLTPEREIVTCNQRIDIPTIEKLTGKKTTVYSDKFSEIIPCIELAGNFLDNFKLEFETNEGVTVLPVEIYPGSTNPLDNPYMSFRHALVLPRGTTGVKSCRLIHKSTKKEVQHNFTFGIMPPPYNYDNALFGYLSYGVDKNKKDLSKFRNIVSTAFGNLSQGLYVLEAQNRPFPMVSTPIPENRNLSMIKFRVTNRTGAKSSLELGFTYRSAENAEGHDIFAVPIADGDNSVIIDIDKGTITTIADSTAVPFMVSFPAKHGNHVITAMNKASIIGDTSTGTITYSYYFKPSLMPVG